MNMNEILDRENVSELARYVGSHLVDMLKPGIGGGRILHAAVYRDEHGTMKWTPNPHNLQQDQLVGFIAVIPTCCLEKGGQIRQDRPADIKQFILDLGVPPNEVEAVLFMANHSVPFGTKLRPLLTGKLGYGDTNTAELLFVGKEENDTIDLCNEISLPANPVTVLTPDDTGHNTPVWQIISKIASSVSPSPEQMTWENYKSNRLFQSGSECVLLEMSPLPKPSDSWPYSLHLSEGEYRDWLSRHAEDRYKAIRGVREKMIAVRGQAASVVTICFGELSNLGCSFLDCFRLSADKAVAKGPFQVFRNARVVLSPFFTPEWGYMTNARIDNLCDIVRELRQ